MDFQLKQTFSRIFIKLKIVEKSSNLKFVILILYIVSTILVVNCIKMKFNNYLSAHQTQRPTETTFRTRQLN